jgi:hypothetical protein
MKVKYNNKTYLIFQNVETGGFVHVYDPVASHSAHITEGIHATAWFQSSIEGFPGNTCAMEFRVEIC